MLVYCEECNKLYTAGILRQSKYFLTRFNLEENKSITTNVMDNKRTWFCYSNSKHKVKLMEHSSSKKSLKFLNQFFIHQDDADIMFIELNKLTPQELIRLNKIIKKNEVKNEVE